MHKLIIRAIGSPNVLWQKEAIQDYLKRLSPFAKIELIEAKEGHQGSTKPDERKTRITEAQNLLKGIPINTIVVALDESGKNLTSLDFSRKLDDWSKTGQSVVFLIGGSWGLDESIRTKAHFTLSLGKHTLPHILARIVLLEQLYRAETILNGKVYHK